MSILLGGEDVTQFQHAEYARSGRGTAGAYGTVVDLLEGWAAKTPEAPAVSFGDETISYGVLDRRANGLAEVLAARGVEHGALVPVMFTDGVELPLTIFALMKLGAAFVPLDDKWPAERIVSVIDSLDTPVVPHNNDASVEASSHPGALHVSASETPEVSASPPRDLSADTLAYGFYTSGSTGMPKCALNVHRGLTNRVLYMTRAFGDSTEEVTLQNSRFVFDSSLWQILWPLSKGGQVVIPRRGGIVDLDETIEIIARNAVTSLDFVPSIFNTLVSMLAESAQMRRKLSSLRTVLVGGEEMNVGAVQRFRQMVPGVEVVNTYGPTECAIGSVFHRVSDQDVDPAPIGSPIDNTHVLVLDDDHRKVSEGQVGEIYIGGDCLGLGYLGDPGKTAEVFCVNPFPEDVPGTRIYRTGDYGRWRPDGLLAYEGRADDQVKVGGVRLELPEVESVVQSHADVNDAKILVDGEQERKLMHAFVTVGSPDVEEKDLRDHVRKFLPPGSVPHRFVIIDEMPLTPNGKADRRKLTEMIRQEKPEDAQGKGSSESTEATIRRLWSDILPGVTPDSDAMFFDVGGDSLSAQRLALAMNSTFGTTATVRDIVQRPTVASQTGWIDGNEGAEAELDLQSADSSLPPDVEFARVEHVEPPSEVLLTGATGFVGAQLTHDLLAELDVVVHCLVRADGIEEGRSRVEQNLARYGLWRHEFSERLRLVIGDLADPELGSVAAWRDLADRVDSVVHNGAVVNLIREYGAHRAANVLGTLEILRFCARGTPKTFHFVSTLSVLSQPQNEAPVAEGDWPEDGYSQSKLVGERLTAEGSSRGLRTSIHRLGEMMPNSSVGVPSDDGLANLLLESCVGLGMRFASDVQMDYLPVDWASRVLVEAVRAHATGYFHHRLAHPVLLDDVLEVFSRTLDLREVDYATFLKAVQAHAGSDGPYGRVAAMLPNDATDLAHLFSSHADCPADNTEDLTRSVGLTWPLLDEVITNYAHHLGRREKHRRAPVAKDSSKENS